MTDPAAHLRRVRVVFDALLDAPPAEREAALMRLAGDDPALRREVQELITASETTASILVSPLAVDPGPGRDAQSIVGERLAAYHVVRLIGMGGMGAVYEAERDDDQYHKRVAIKIVQRDIDSELTVARFRRERQILASLEHPNIATLVDGGVMPDGRPFLVMEYVDGAPITTWCNARALSVRDRVALFRQVCAAVQHAHRNLVIHRDLKPGNILVTDEGLVKLLDFGIAKLLTADDAAEMPLTRGGARAFTPEYASPEQIRGGPLSTASDIYSLGVVLFELLAGRRPHVVTGRAMVDIERAVLDTPAPRPSTVVTDHAARHAGDRTVDRLRRRLRGELDSVTLTALQPEPARRYASVEALNDDLGHYLAGMPVRAQADWGGYRLAKFAQRNVAAVTASLLVLVALIGGIITTTMQAHRARQEQAKEQQVDRFLRGLLASVQPGVGRRDVAVSEVLDSASNRLDRELAGEPEVRAELEAVIGRSYDGLGRYSDAEPHFKLALALQRQVSSPTSDAVITRLGDLGELYIDQGALDSAGVTFADALAAKRAQGGAPDSLYAALLNDQGSTAYDGGRAGDAERLHRQALAIQRKVLGPRNDMVAETLEDIGTAVAEQGRLAEGDSLVRVGLAIVRSTHPELSLAVANALSSLTGVLDMEGNAAATDSAYREMLALRKKLLGTSHPDYTLTLVNYSAFIFDQKRYQEAADYSRQILALRGTVLPESHPSIAFALQTLGRSLDQLGDTKAGEQALIESLELRRKYIGAESWPVASAQGALGEHYTFVKDYPKAEQILLHAQELFARTVGATNNRTAANTRRLVALYTAWGKPARVAQYTALLPRADP